MSSPKKKAAGTTENKAPVAATARQPNNAVSKVPPTSPTTTTTTIATPPAITTNKVTSTTTTPWARRFLAATRSDVLLPIPRDFIEDAFNLAQLPPVVERLFAATTAAAAATSTVSEDNDRVVVVPRETATTKDPDDPYPVYRQALRRILDHDDDDDNDNDKPTIKQKTATTRRRLNDDEEEVAARALYCLIHQRYITSPRGLDTIRRRFLLPATKRNHNNNNNNDKNTHACPKVDAIFGRCPNLDCRGYPLLPAGASSNLSPEFWWSLSKASCSRTIESSTHGENCEHRALRYCVSCRQVVYHQSSLVDGCAWGPSFCFLLLMVYGESIFEKQSEDRAFSLVSNAELNRNVATNIPATILGFRVHPSAVLYKSSNTRWRGMK